MNANLKKTIIVVVIAFLTIAGIVVIRAAKRGGSIAFQNWASSESSPSPAVSPDILATGEPASSTLRDELATDTSAMDLEKVDLSDPIGVSHARVEEFLTRGETAAYSSERVCNLPNGRLVYVTGLVQWTSRKADGLPAVRYMLVSLGSPYATFMTDQESSRIEDRILIEETMKAIQKGVSCASAYRVAQNALYDFKTSGPE